MGTIQIDGSTPKLTIGNATAEDALIVFDGNAQDFYIGLDDSADDLVIGLGSAAGTTPAISINEDRDVTISDGAIDFDIASHDTSNGLKLGGTLVTATAAELNIMDGVGATASEINLIDGSAKSTSSITIADADAFIVIDGTTTKQIPASDIKTYAGGAVSAINNATANELVTIGSTTTELDAESGLTYTDGALVIGGTTPSLTIGDAGAEDTKIVFDGNAQDFHIGLDDSADDLVIGLGSSLGTTTHMSFDETGAVLKPLQPAFLLHTPDGSQTFASGGGDDITFATEVFDQNSDVSSSIFTAPVTGRYLFCARLRIESYTNDNAVYTKIITSNRSYSSFMRIGSTTDDNTEFNFGEWVITEMDANDTAKVNASNSAGNGTVAEYQEAYFSGVLLC